MPDDPAPSPPPPAPIRRSGRSAGVAAGLTLALASIGLAIHLVQRAARDGGLSRGTATQLVASAAAVAARHPNGDVELSPVTDDELARPFDEPFVHVRGVAIVDPVGAVTTDRPTFRWRGVPSTSDATVVVTDADGAIVLRVTTATAQVEFPARTAALRIGVRYKASVTTAAGESWSRFLVLGVPHRTRWRTIVGDVESNEPAAVRDLLLAHGAWRRGIYGEALRRAEVFAKARPDDPAGRPILSALRRRLGLDP